MEFAFLIVGLLVGAAVGFLLGKRGGTGNADNGELEKLKLEKAALSEAERRLTEDRNRLQSESANKDERISQLNGRIEASLAKFQEQEKRLTEQRQEFEELNKRFNTEFENLANKILDEKSKKFTDQNKENLETILKPLRENIEKFEKKVEEKYDNEQKERATLKGEIKMLHDLNKKISEEAHNLTTALKGDSKKQGNWGELILERILENSGLIKGEEYSTQETTYNETGDRLQPDVVIHLPDEKHIIIDSKVSLVAYEQFVNADTDEQREQAMKAHVLSVKTHIKGLSEKNYHTARGLNSPEFVLMFMPIESSFSLSVRADDELFNFAWDKRIVIVSPSTLLATLRTVASIWKQDRQTKNALDIAEKSGRLYDKFVGFVEDMQKIGDRLQSTQKVYDEGMKKLTEGRGNLVNRAEELRQMGAKATKQLPSEILGLEDEDQ
ncbi:MAG: DNA recombination protein RmuC [Flavobacteriales bacterium]|nr:DNA recombination protein RmuC [Flavobacteriales bacterium]